MIISIDAGNNGTKVVCENGVLCFDSTLGDGRELNIKSEVHDPMDGVFKDKRFFAGDLAKRESYYPRQMFGLTKAHNDMLMRCLIAIHRVSDDKVNHIIVNQPIKAYTDEEKKLIKQMLIGEHEMTLNGKNKTIVIEEAEVSPEGAGAYFALDKQYQNITICDVGSSTINLAAIRDYDFSDRDSDTILLGTDVNEYNDITSLSQSALAKLTKNHLRSDKIAVVGGSAYEVADNLKSYFSDVRIVEPYFLDSGDFKRMHPKFATAIGFYHLAKEVYAHVR